MCFLLIVVKAIVLTCGLCGMIISYQNLDRYELFSGKERDNFINTNNFFSIISILIFIFGMVFFLL